MAFSTIRIFKNYLILIITIIAISGCNEMSQNNRFEGFWEGPHPEDSSRKFYIHVFPKDGLISAKGFWTHNNFYNSEFKIDSLSIHTDSIRFFIQKWDCYYIGKLHEARLIIGGFSCTNEPFDEVNLVRNEKIKQYLTEAKPGCNSPSYQYAFKVPDGLNSHKHSDGFLSQNDSAFFISLIPEIIENKYGRINSFLLAKRGELICEEYFYGYSKDDLHQIESCTKSITSLLIGIARDKGMITDINEPLHEVFPSFPHLNNDEYNKLTISNLLSMTSGFSPEYEPSKSHNRIAHALRRELVQKPGEGFIYDGGNTEILGAIIRIKTNMYADAFAEKYLFKPLNFKKYNWSIYKQDSFPCMGGSLQLRPRDMMKIGLLVLNNGNYASKQIISEKWIQESTSVKTETHIEDDDYGFLWWCIILHSQQQKYKTIWANGLGSQFIYIIPDLDVVIVTTGHNYENDSWAISDGINKYLYLLDE